MKRSRSPSADDLYFPPLPGVSGVMEAVCGYARTEGLHQCSAGPRASCDPAPWQRVRNRVITLVWAVLEDVRDADDPKAEAERLIAAMLDQWAPGLEDAPEHGAHRDKRWFEVVRESLMEGGTL